MERQASRRWRGGYNRRRRKKPLAERLADWTRSFIAFLFSNVGIICLVVGYTIAGASIFMAIEGSAEFETFFADSALNNTASQLWDLITEVRILQNFFYFAHIIFNIQKISFSFTLSRSFQQDQKNFVNTAIKKFLRKGLSKFFAEKSTNSFHIWWKKICWRIFCLNNLLETFGHYFHSKLILLVDCGCFFSDFYLIHELAIQFVDKNNFWSRNSFLQNCFWISDEVFLGFQIRITFFLVSLHQM